MPTHTEPQTLRAFLGLHFFEDRDFDRALFFGRETEIKQLTERIIAEDLTVLFGKSGDGKTSLINAGLKPKLRELGYLPVRARLFNLPKHETPLDALYHTLAEEAEAQQVTLPSDWQRATLWETFFALQPASENQLKPIVLILDQFEELFTLMAGRPSEQEDFITQLADLVRGRLPEAVRENYRTQLAALPANSEAARKLEQLLYGAATPVVRLVLSLREDYLAFLNNLGKRIPKVFASRYRLASLTIEQARLAIANPPQQEVLGEQKFRIDDDAIAALLKFLTVQSSSSGKSEETVGPPQLQVLLSQLEKQMREQGRDRITSADLGGEKGMRQMLSRYYRGILAQFPSLRVGPGPRRLTGLGVARRLQPLHSPRFAVRCLCEERLITAGGNRNSRHEDEIIREIGVAERDLQQLVDSRLLRREPRLQESFYELSHDSLVPSLQAAGGLRKAWVTSLKFAAIAGLVFVVMNWGVPFVQSFFAMDTLRAEFEAIKEGRVSVGNYRERLDPARSSVRDTTSLTKLRKEFDAWRRDMLQRDILAPSTNRKTADSLLSLLQREYPSETPWHNALSDTLYLRSLRQIEQAYEALVAVTSADSLAFALTSAQALLDSVQARFAGKVRITELRADLAQRQSRFFIKQKRFGEARKAIHMADILFEQARTQRASARFALQDALELREPRVAEVAVEVKAVDKEANQANKTFLIAISPPAKFLSSEEVKALIMKNDFYCQEYSWSKEWSNPKGQGIANDFILESNGQVVFDRATGLRWQRGGSTEEITFAKAQEYLAEMNRQKFAGYDDWRLPTLEEAMSLMEPKRSGELHIDKIFDRAQQWIWTSDRASGSSCWVAYFGYGDCSHQPADHGGYVRLVR